jgi:hypothetical protein
VFTAQGAQLDAPVAPLVELPGAQGVEIAPSPVTEPPLHELPAGQGTTAPLV